MSAAPSTGAPAAVSIKVNGRLARTIEGAAHVPQGPLQIKLHSRSIGYSQMADGSSFASYVKELHFEPANATSAQW